MAVMTTYLSGMAAKAICVGRWSSVGDICRYVGRWGGEGNIWWGGEDEVFKWDGSDIYRKVRWRRRYMQVG